MQRDRKVLLAALIMLGLAIALIALLAPLAGEGPCADGGGAPGCNGELW